jgi:hypothetical protein
MRKRKARSALKERISPTDRTVKGGPKKTAVTIPEYLTVQVSPFDGLHVLNGLITDETKRIPDIQVPGKAELAHEASPGRYRLATVKFSSVPTPSGPTARGDDSPAH